MLGWLDHLFADEWVFVPPAGKSQIIIYFNLQLVLRLALQTLRIPNLRVLVVSY